jgi:hypothetical protein
MKLLKENRHRLDALTQSLLESDSLDEAQILEATGLKAPAPAATASS